MACLAPTCPIDSRTPLFTSSLCKSSPSTAKICSRSQTGTSGWHLLLLSIRFGKTSVLSLLFCIHQINPGPLSPLSPRSLSLCAMLTEIELRDDKEKYKSSNEEKYTDLDDAMKKAVHDYLEERRVSDDLATFLHGYIANKDKTQHIRWLTNIESYLKK